MLRGCPGWRQHGEESRTFTEGWEQVWGLGGEHVKEDPRGQDARRILPACICRRVALEMGGEEWVGGMIPTGVTQLGLPLRDNGECEVLELQEGAGSGCIHSAHVH